MVYLILGFYVIPMILAMLMHYFDKKTETVEDFLHYWWAFTIPIINIISVLGVTFIIIGEYYQKFKNIKLKK